MYHQNYLPTGGYRPVNQPEPASLLDTDIFSATLCSGRVALYKIATVQLLCLYRSQVQRFFMFVWQSHFECRVIFHVCMASGSSQTGSSLSKKKESGIYILQALSNEIREL